MMANFPKWAALVLITYASHAAPKMKAREISRTMVYVTGKPCIVSLKVDEFSDPISFTPLKPCKIDGADAAKGATISWRAEFQTSEQFRMKSKKPRVKDGIAYASDVVYYAGRDDIHFATLAQDTEIQGITFRGGKKIHYHRNGKVRMGFVAKNTVVEGKTIAAKHMVALDSQGRLAEIGDIPDSLRSTGDTLFRPGTLKKYEYIDSEESVEFRTQEFAASGILADAHEFSCGTGKNNEGWRATFAAETELSVYTRDELKNKKGAWSTIKRGTLATEAFIDGKKYSAGKSLTFGEKCKVVNVK